MKKFIHVLIPLLLIIGSFLIYKNIYPNPRDWYDHYLYLTRSLLQGRVDIPDLPSFYHDKLEFEGRTYIPFPPGASFLLLPFVYFFSNITQQQVSVIIGSITIVAVYILLNMFATKKNSLLLTLFFAFGTPFFWTVVVGTTWFFAHTVAVLFITLSLIFHFKQKNFLSGIFFALASLTRLPLIIAGLFFVLELFKKKGKLFMYLLGASFFVPIFLIYNYLRFGDVFETGYEIVYSQYADSSIKYSSLKSFEYFDYRNIPAHLYTFFLMPPNINVAEGKIIDLKPSPFGMGILFTSPLLLTIFFSRFKRGTELNAFLVALFCSLPSFLHYAQGWVQFGYRFILDFIIFLMIILAFKFKETKFNLFLIAISVVVNYWGVLWAIELGW